MATDLPGRLPRRRRTESLRAEANKVLVRANLARAEGVPITRRVLNRAIDQVVEPRRLHVALHQIALEIVVARQFSAVPREPLLRGNFLRRPLHEPAVARRR